MNNQKLKVKFVCNQLSQPFVSKIIDVNVIPNIGDTICFDNKHYLVINKIINYDPLINADSLDKEISPELVTEGIIISLKQIF